MASRGPVSGELTFEEAVVLLPRVLDTLAAAEWWRRSEGKLAEAVAMFGRAEARCVAGQVAVVAEAVERGAPFTAGQKSGAGWLRSLVPVTPAVAKVRSVLAAAFGTQAKPVEVLAPTAAAFAAGDISVGHATVLVRTMDAVADIPEIDSVTAAEGQALMLTTAAVVDPAQLGRAGLRLRHRLDPQAAERLARDEDRQFAQREVVLWQESTGMWRLSGHLPAVTGAALAAALDPLAGPEPAQNGTPDARSHRQRTCDALGTLAELSLAARAGEPGGLPRRAGAWTRLILTADLATLRAGLAHPMQPAGGQGGSRFGLLETGEPGGWEVSPLTSQVLACDAEVIPMLLDETTGRPLDVGDAVYQFPPRIRKAIETRDGHCSYPGCSAKPPWCHTHHLVAFGRHGRPGGSTSEANGTLLCGRHHRYVHAHAWKGRLIDGHIVWRPPSPLDQPDDPEDGWQTNAHVHHFEQALQQLARRWLQRTRQRAPDNTG